jgi:sialidase-1
MTVRLSADQGKKWPAARVLYPKSAAYSSLVALPNERMGCLYERDGYKEIVFVRFGLGWLAGGRDHVSP